MKHFWPKLVAGLLVAFALLQGSASLLGSVRGEAGLVVGLLVVAGLLAIERLLFGQSFTAAARALGLGSPEARGVVTAAALCLALVLVIPIYAHAAHVPIAWYPGWGWLVPGLFAQAGIAEEILFRGYLFGHLRRRHPFWRAACLAMVPFVAVHLLMFATMPWPIASAAMVLAVTMSFPLAHLFELAGRTIWAAALVHFVVQAALKVTALPEEAGMTLPLVWMAASAVVPYLVFLVPRRSAPPERG